MVNCKASKTLVILLSFFFISFLISCGGGDGEKDGDAGEFDVVEEDEGVIDVDAQDIPGEDIQPEEVAQEDVVEDDVQEDDVQEEDALVDDGVEPEVDVEVEEEEVPAECRSYGTLSCGDSLTGETTTDKPDTLNGYNCIGYDESGGDITYTFEALTSPRIVTISITTSGEDLDIVVLTTLCDPSTCIAYGANTGSSDSVTFRAEAETDYYIVVDGYDGATDNFDITVDCVDAEICDNDVDDNGNGVIDCWDSECADAPGCVETVCNDGVDNDGDGFTDSFDDDCSEVNCSDGVDDDADGAVDCDDVDCFFDTTGACATGSAQIGDPCTSNSDCASGQCFTEFDFGFPSGYCVVLSFTEDCSSLACPSGSMCVSFGFFGPWGCLDECDAGACREAYTCYDLDEDTIGDICTPGCSQDDQCTETELCNEDSGSCITAEEVCTGGADEDMDGFTDCEDTDCELTTDCGFPAPTNLNGGDTCADAVEIPMPDGERGQVALNGTTTGMSDNITTSCGAGSGTEDVIYTFTLTSQAFVRIDVVGGADAPMHPDTVVSLRQDCDGEDILCNDDYRRVYHHSRIDAMLTAGTYYIVVDGFTVAGDFTLYLQFMDSP